MIPPHLPAPTCNIARHHRFERFKWLFVSMVVSIVAGFAGAAIVVGWFLPRENFTPISQWYFPATFIHTPVSDAWMEKISEENRLVTVYSAAESVESAVVLTQKNRLGVGVFVSSDGWIVGYFGDAAVEVKKWKVVYNNHVYGVEKILTDPSSHLIYCKIAPIENGGAQEQFPAVSFAPSVDVKAEVGVYDGQFVEKAIVKNALTLTALSSHLDSAAVWGYDLGQNFPSGNMVFDKQGRLVGIMRQGSFLLDQTAITAVLPHIFAGQAMVRFSLGVEGYLPGEVVNSLNGTVVPGFLVTKVYAKGSVLKVGDIIQEINGQFVNDKKLWYYDATTTVRLQVRRGARTLDLKAIFQNN